ncbi:thymidine phosphorylase [Aureimonas jatrophae]|uniref:Thymidine phosphorylase n=1 Tax=Aureimonas jatrophae TaxID=1166073 RepID=A0A1H0LTS2_9HYPH|nr:thymidine phosphorylase [Aureimonas jatrophae]MBB3952737.1 thymidine phosphorylase [Aureimonas jatrophae]SDO71376.1 thymidine phosphorylase [Aureimonas jatrophae]
MARFLPQEAIRQKRDGATLDAADIRRLVEGVTGGEVSDAQIAAFAMAVFLRGMTPGETVELTLAMRDSGDALRWDDLPGPTSDKHSTGGVGDNVSLMLAPIAASCGLFVPMISGRGLGHTGGTLDKLEAIPGYDVRPDEATFRRAVREAGCAIVGQTARLAPADGRLYAVRDVTATVESVPLITASILSKKLAAGLRSLVLDVKTGSGAFMSRREDAETLALSLVEVARGAGLAASALVTDMDQPLASAAGNAVEVANAVRFLTGERQDARLREVTLALCGEMLVLAKLAETAEAGIAVAARALDEGHAAERFGRMVAMLGGPADYLERFDHHLPEAPVHLAVSAGEAGTVRAVDARALGLAVVQLGGGRTRAEDPVDPAVGLTDLAAIGQRVERGDALALVHARDRASAEAAVAAVRAAYDVGEATAAGPAVIGRIG